MEHTKYSIHRVQDGMNHLLVRCVKTKYKVYIERSHKQEEDALGWMAGPFEKRL